MICKNCNNNIPDESLFCPSCGMKVEEKKESKFCPVCGTDVNIDTKFCPNCGKSLQEEVQESVQKNEEHTPVTSKSKINKTYGISIFSAIITFFLRINNQKTFYSWANVFSNRVVVGLDSDLKTFFTAIPVVVAVIVLLMIVTDEKSDTQQKLKAVIINGGLIALSVLFIWFDIPNSIIDF